MTFTPEIRKKCMQSNKSKDTKPELMLRKSLREHGLGGYRLHWDAPGKPDVCYPGKKVAIFVNGCYWHRCPLCNPPVPQSNELFWKKKFERNVQRDKENEEDLKSMGWTVLTVWECEIKKELDNVISRIEQSLQ